MTDKELIQQEIDKIKGYINSARSTGRTYQLANTIISDFWDMPMGTEIQIEDHCKSEHNNRNLAMLIKGRIEHDFPGVDFRVYCMGQGNWFIVRESQNFKENALEHLKGWEKRLEECE